MVHSDQLDPLWCKPWQGCNPVWGPHKAASQVLTRCCRSVEWVVGWWVGLVGVHVGVTSKWHPSWAKQASPRVHD